MSDVDPGGLSTRITVEGGEVGFESLLGKLALTRRLVRSVDNMIARVRIRADSSNLRSTIREVSKVGQVAAAASRASVASSAVAARSQTAINKSLRQGELKAEQDHQRRMVTTVTKGQTATQHYQRMAGVKAMQETSKARKLDHIQKDFQARQAALPGSKQKTLISRFQKQKTQSEAYQKKIGIPADYEGRISKPTSARTPVAPVPVAPRQVPTPEARTPVAPVPVAPRQVPTPEARTPVAPVPVAPRQVPTPEARTPVAPVPVAPRQVPTPEARTPVAPVPVAPRQVPTPEARTPVAPVPVAPRQVPTPEARTPVAPVPVAPRPTTTTPGTPEVRKPIVLGTLPRQITPEVKTPVVPTPVISKPITPEVKPSPSRIDQFEKRFLPLGLSRSNVFSKQTESLSRIEQFEKRTLGKLLEPSATISRLGISRQHRLPVPVAAPSVPIPAPTPAPIPIRDLSAFDINKRQEAIAQRFDQDRVAETTASRYRQRYQIDARQTRRELDDLVDKGLAETRFHQGRTYYTGLGARKEGYRPTGRFAGDQLFAADDQPTRRKVADRSTASEQPPPRRGAAGVGGAGGRDTPRTGVADRPRPRRRQQFGALLDLGATQAQFITATYAIRRFNTALIAIPAAISIALGVVTVLASRTAASFEDAFVGVRKTVDGSVDDLDRVRESVVQTSFDVPIKFEELSRGAQVAGQLGIPLEHVQRQTKLYAMLEEATEIPIEQSAPLISQSANILNVPLRLVESLMSAVVHMGNTTIATERKMLPTMERISYWSRQMGFTPGQIAGLSAVTVSAALRPQQAEAAFRGIAQEIFTPVLSGDKSKLGHAQGIIQAGLGDEVISRQDVFSTIQRNPAEFFRLLQGGFRALDEKGQLDKEPAVFKFFEQMGIDNTREQASIARMFTSSADIYEILMSAQNAFELGTALQIEYSKAVDTFMADLTRATNSWSAFMDSVGTPFNERLRPLLRSFAGAFQNIRSSFLTLTNPKATYTDRIMRLGDSPLADIQEQAKQRKERWDAIGENLRETVSNFFAPFITFSSVEKAIDSVEKFGNSLITLGQKLTPVGQDIVSKVGGVAESVMGSPKLLEFGIRFTAIGTSIGILSGILLGFLALLSGPAGWITLLGLSGTALAAFLTTVKGSDSLFEKSREELSLFQKGLDDFLRSIGVLGPEEPPPGEGTTFDLARQALELEKQSKMDKFEADYEKNLETPFGQTGIGKAYLSASLMAAASSIDTEYFNKFSIIDINEESGRPPKDWIVRLAEQQRSLSEDAYIPGVTLDKTDDINVPTSTDYEKTTPGNEKGQDWDWDFESNIGDDPYEPKSIVNLKTVPVDDIKPKEATSIPVGEPKQEVSVNGVPQSTVGEPDDSLFPPVVLKTIPLDETPEEALARHRATRSSRHRPSSTSVTEPYQEVPQQEVSVNVPVGEPQEVPQQEVSVNVPVGEPQEVSVNVPIGEPQEVPQQEVSVNVPVGEPQEVSVNVPVGEPQEVSVNVPIGEPQQETPIDVPLMTVPGLELPQVLRTEPQFVTPAQVGGAVTHLGGDTNIHATFNVGSADDLDKAAASFAELTRQFKDTVRTTDPGEVT